jgi:small GTP-binding protein
LTTLDLRKNKISHLPREITQLNMAIKCIDRHFLEGINLYGNPLESPPVEIVQQGKEAVITWFKSLEDKARVRALNEVKVLLVGDGGAGKTSLVKRLLEQGFDKNEPQTHGININHWEVKHKKEKIKVNIWDFGGQEIMHATHQFFLSKRSLYILVLDGRKEKKIDYEYWLKHVKSFGGDSPVLVVINKIDENPGFDVNRLFLKEKYPNIKGFFRVSCFKGDGIQTFSRNLARELAKVDLISTPWGENWFKVKIQLEQMKKKKKNFISYDDYNTLCQKENIFDTSGQDTLVEFLNDLGVVIHFKDFKLKETYVLEPEWVTTAVYKIINSREIAEAMGLLKLNRLDEILKQKSPEDHYYPPEKYRFIIELMQKFELCYEIDRETILIPDLLEVQQPKFAFDYNGALKFQVKYDFLPRSIMPRFIVKMHRDIKKDLHWRTGVVLEDKAFGCTAVVKSDDEAGKIYIYVQGDQKRYYFAIIRHTIRDINHSFEKLEISERVPVPDDPIITVSYDHLLKLNKMGEKYYIPEGVEKRYDIANLLDGFEETKASSIALNINKRWRILDDLDALIFNPDTKESEIHKILENNLWIMGVEYAKMSSNETLKKTVEQYLGKKYKGDSAKNRPDLLLTGGMEKRYLLIEFKKPGHTLARRDEYQAVVYRDELNAHIPDSKIEITLLGGRIKENISPHNLEKGVEYLTYKSVISNARNNLKWLIEDIDRELDHTQKD